MFLIKPRHPGVIDALTGNPMPTEGVLRGVLLPVDHYNARTGDVEINPATVTPPPKRQARPARQATPE